MSGTATPAPTTQREPKATRTGSDDGRALAQVEKWMETIRELSREPAKN
jgi:hypothetical protein